MILGSNELFFETNDLLDRSGQGSIKVSILLERDNPSQRCTVVLSTQVTVG